MITKHNQAYLFLLAVMVFSVLATPFAFLGFTSSPAGNGSLQESVPSMEEQVVSNSDLKQFKSAPQGVPGAVSSVDAVLFVNGVVSSYNKSSFDSTISGLEGVGKVSSSLSSLQGVVSYTAEVELEDLNHYDRVASEVAGAGFLENASFYKRGLVEYEEGDFVDVFDENIGLKLVPGKLDTVLFPLSFEGMGVNADCWVAVDSSNKVVEGYCQQAVR